MPKSKIISLFMKKSKKPTKIENCPLEKFLSDLVIKQVNLLVFMTML